MADNAAPVITGSFTNTTIYQNVTVPQFAHTETFTNAECASRVLRIYKGQAYDVSFDIPDTSPAPLRKIEIGGTFNWTYTVMDTNGFSTSTAGTVTVTSYEFPTIVYFTAGRNATNPATIDVAVKVTKGSYSISNVKINTWIEGNQKYNDLDVNPTGSDRSTFIRTYSRGQLDDVLVQYFELLVSDGIATTNTRIAVNPDVPLLNIEKRGVGIGQVVKNGTVSNKKLEVSMASEFNNSATFNGWASFDYGSNFPTSMYIQNKRFDKTQSRETITVWGTGFSPYNPYTPTLYRIGPLVLFFGAATITTDLPSGNYGVLTGRMISAQFCPLEALPVCAFTTMGTVARMRIDKSGRIDVMNDSSFTYNAGTGIFFSAMWIAKDSSTYNEN